jgi:hypothetical protein
MAPKIKVSDPNTNSTIRLIILGISGSLDFETMGYLPGLECLYEATVTSLLRGAPAIE